MNFIERQDNLLTRKECMKAIEWVSKNKELNLDENKETHTGYNYYNLMRIDEDPQQCFSPEPLRPLLRAINSLKDSYIKNFPEVSRIHAWDLQYIRLKHWQPGYYYSSWHSEQGVGFYSNRVLSFLLYLSDNNSYTEFRRYRKVQTKAGRGILFPSHFTHEHRGSICKNGLDRYVLSGYYCFT